MPFDEFVANVAHVFEVVADTGETVVVEKEGAEVVVAPVPARRRGRATGKTAADRAAFRAAAGSWKDVDTDRLVADIHESRRRSSRPPVEL